MSKCVCVCVCLLLKLLVERNKCLVEAQRVTELEARSVHNRTMKQNHLPTNRNSQ